MKDIFVLSKLLLKEKLRILSDREKLDLSNLREKYPWTRDVDYGKISQKISYYDTIDQDEAWETLQKGRANRKGATPIFPRRWLGYAAIFIGLFTISVFLYLNYTQPDTTIVGQQSNITLQLENGEQMTLVDSTQQQIVNSEGQQIGIQKGNQLDYSNTDGVEELVFNELSVPYGKRFELVLSDGTHVYLNAGTSIKYPVKFLKGQNRQVYLKGEGYFDVAKDSLHPFVVNASDIEVEVLGTEFNISSYPGDVNTNTVLVEGSVSVSHTAHSNHPSILTPGYMATWSQRTENISVHKVDTEIYTGWVQGKLIFKDVSFDNIIKRLQRQYDVRIDNKNPALNTEKFDATFDIETIEQVLQSFKENHPDLNYQVHDDGNITIY